MVCWLILVFTSSLAQGLQSLEAGYCVSTVQAREFDWDRSFIRGFLGRSVCTDVRHNFNFLCSIGCKNKSTACVYLYATCVHLSLYTHIHWISGWGQSRQPSSHIFHRWLPGTFERHGSRCTRRLSRRGSGISSGFSQPFPSGPKCEPTTAAVGPATVPPRRSPGSCRLGGGF